jgi:hypothetical protein
MEMQRRNLRGSENVFLPRRLKGSLRYSQMVILPPMNYWIHLLRYYCLVLKRVLLIY